MSTMTATPARRAAPSPGLARGDAVVSVVAALALLLPGVLSFGPVFGGAEGYLAAGGGAVLGVALAVIARHRRWAMSTTVAVAVGVYLLFGGVLALRPTTWFGFVPTPDTLLRLVPLSVQAWRDLLTVRPPAGSFVGPAVVPYLAGLLTGWGTARFTGSARRYLWALLPAFVLLLIGILWGIDVPAAGGVLGVAFAVVALLWAVWRRYRATALTGEEVLADGSAISGPRTLAAAAGLVAVATAVSVAMMPLLDPTGSRVVLRQYVQPPLNLQDYASPLTSYRHLLDGQREATLFSVSGLPERGRLQVATLDAYDGRVYSVDQDSARFLRIGPRVYGTAAGTPQTLSLAIDQYDSVWLPGGGDVRGVRFAGPNAAAQAEGLYYNAAGGTLLTTAGVAARDSYAVDLIVPPRAEDTSAQRLAQVPMGAVTRVPDVVSETATSLIGEASTPIEQLRAIEKGLQEGYYLTGPTSRPGHSLERISSMLTADTMVGDDEQYAVAMALMARQLDIPARVVMGFYADKDTARSGPLAITGDMAHVWVEVPFEGQGWVTFDPTPDRDRVPMTTVPKPRPKPRPQVLPPPDPPINVVPDDPIKNRDNPNAQPDIPPDLLRLLVTIGLSLLALAALASPFVVIAWLKSRRRERRRHAPEIADRFSGAWEEIEDAATDLGTRVPTPATRSEAAHELALHHPTVSLAGVAADVDAAVFGPGNPSEEAAAAVWKDVDTTLVSLQGGLGRWARVRSFLSLRSFRRPGRGRLVGLRPRLSLPRRKVKP